MDMHLLINGLPVQAHYSREETAHVLRPLLSRMTAMQESLGRRLVVFLAGPPGCGKSTLAAALAQMDDRVQPLGMDGFHFPQSHISAHTVLRDGAQQPMSQYKGAPESFDALKLLDYVHALAQDEPVNWPIYDRRIHDVSSEGTPVTRPIALVEGNYLLLSASPWNDLRCDLSVFITAQEAMLADRVAARKIQGGYDPREAWASVRRNDAANIRLVLSHSRPADLTLFLQPGGYTL